MKRHPGGPDPQAIYARWLEFGARAVFAFSLLAFVLYLTGILAPAIALQDLPRLWALPASEFLKQANVPQGWGWLPLVARGDYLNLLAIALLALLSLACSARMVPAFLRSGERVQAALALAQAVVLLAAAASFFPGAR